MASFINRPNEKAISVNTRATGNRSIVVRGSAYVGGDIGINADIISTQFYRGNGLFLTNISRLWDNVRDSVLADTFHLEGNVGIGTDRPDPTYRLDVRGGMDIFDSINCSNFRLQEDVSGFTLNNVTQLFFDDRGNVIVHDGNVSSNISGSVRNTMYVNDLIRVDRTLIVDGNLTVSNSNTEINTSDFVITDNIFTLSDGQISPAFRDSGIIIDRGDINTNNTAFIWDESNKEFTFVTMNSSLQMDIFGNINILDYSNAHFKDVIVNNNVTSTLFRGNGTKLTGVKIEYFEKFKITIDEFDKIYVDGVLEAPIMLLRGYKYVFDISNAITSLPFNIMQNTTIFTNGVSNTNILSSSATPFLFFYVPYDAPGDLRYQFGMDSVISGKINMAGTVLQKGGNVYLSVNNHENENMIHMYTDGTEKMQITNTGKIGLNINQPIEQLDVNGNIWLSGNITTSGLKTFNLGSNNSYWHNLYARSIHNCDNLYQLNGSDIINNTNMTVSNIQATNVNSTEILIYETGKYIPLNKWIGHTDIYNIGNVSIGTSAHSEKLVVIGNATFDNTLNTTQLQINDKYVDETIHNYWDMPNKNTLNIHFENLSGNVGVHVSEPEYTLDVCGTVNATYYRGDASLLTDLRTNRWSGESELYYMLGNVGIGYVNPIEKLHVNGAMIIGNTSNSIINNGTIRWNGLNYEGFVNHKWESLSIPDGIPVWSNNTVIISNTSTLEQFYYDTGYVGINKKRPLHSLDINGSMLVTGNLSINNLLLEATPIELNIIKGITANTTELNIMSLVNATTYELNFLANVTPGYATPLHGLVVSNDNNLILNNNGTGHLVSHNVTITNSLRVDGTTIISGVNQLSINDSVIKLNNNTSNYAADNDSGIILNQCFTDDNIGFIWHNERDEFASVFTKTTIYTLNNTIQVNGYTDVMVEDLIVNSTINASYFEGNGYSVSNTCEYYSKQFTVSHIGGAFEIDGEIQQNITLVRGERYLFNVQDVDIFHPFTISQSTTGGANNNPYLNGVIGNGSTQGSDSQSLIFNVPYNAPGNLYYQSGNDMWMGGHIYFTDSILINSDYDSYISVEDIYGSNQINLRASGEDYVILTNNSISIDVVNVTELFEVNGNIGIYGNLLPGINNTFNIGDINSKFGNLYANDVYLSNNSLYMNGELVLSTNDNGNIQLVVESITNSLLTLEDLTITENGNQIGISKWAISQALQRDFILNNTITYHTSTISIPRKDFAMGSSGDITILTSGNEASPVSRIDVYDGTYNTWREASVLIPRYNHSVIGRSGKFYIAGGLDSDDVPLNDIEVFDENTNLSTSFGTLSVARMGLTSNSIGDYLVFAGENAGSNVVDLYNMETDVWSYATLSQSGELPDSAVLNGKLYIAGGNGANNVDIFNPNGNTSWSVATIPLAGLGMSVEAAYPYLLIAGGWKDSYLNDIYIYNVKTDVWTQSTLLHQKRNMFSGSAYNKIIFAGGEEGSSYKFNDVEIFDAKTNTWSYTTLNKERMIGKSHKMGVTISNYDVRFVIAGGLDLALPLNNVDIFEYSKNEEFSLIEIVNPNNTISQEYDIYFVNSTNTTGFVGIGTVDPKVNLDVVGNVSIQETINTMNFIISNTTVNTSKELFWERPYKGDKLSYNLGNVSINNATDTLFFNELVNINGIVNTSIYYGNGSLISNLVTNRWSGDTNLNYIHGNVSIGTNISESILHVDGGLIIANSSTEFAKNGTMRYIKDYFQGRKNDNWVQFNLESGLDPVWKDVGNPQDIYYMGSNIGIGLNIPTERLNVLGNVSITGTLLFNESTLITTPSELNILTDVILTTNEFNILTGIDITTNNLNALHNTTSGVVSANKVIIPDINNNLSFVNGSLIVDELVLVGNLTTYGNTTYINTENLIVNNSIISLHSNYTDAGFIISRNTSDNVAIVWKDYDNEFVFISTIHDSNESTNNITICDYSNIHIDQIIVDGNVTATNLVGSSLGLTDLITNNWDENININDIKYIDGNVGINYINSEYTLTVNGSVNINVFENKNNIKNIVIDSNDSLLFINTNTGHIGFGNKDPVYPIDISDTMKISDISIGARHYHNNIIDINSNYSKANDILIQSYTTGNTTSELFIDTTTGNIGMGNNMITPTKKLSVNGSVKVFDKLSVGYYNNTHEFNVNGSINATSYLGNGTDILDLLWTRNTNDDNIHYICGSVGIGTDSPISELEVNGSISADYFVGNGSGLTDVEYWNDINSDINYLGGNVGIGIVNPTSLLHVIGTLNATLFLGDGSNITGFTTVTWSEINNTAYYLPGNVSINTEDSQQFSVYVNGSGNVIVDLDNNSNDRILNIKNLSDINYLVVNGTSKSVMINRDESYNSVYNVDVCGTVKVDNLILGELVDSVNRSFIDITGGIDDNIQFTSNIDNNTTNQLFINMTTGYIGIGSNKENPLTDIDVNGTVEVFDIVKIGLTGSGNLNEELQVEGTINATSFVGDGVDILDLLWTRNTSNDDIHYVCGSIGIGTNTPTSELDVAGTIKANDFVGNGSLISYASQWSNTSTLIYYMGGNVGIGTSTPSVALEIIGNLSATTLVGDGSQLTGIISSAWLETINVIVESTTLSADFTYSVATLTRNRRNVGIGSENDIVVIGPGRESSGLTDYDIYNATTGVWVTAASVAARYAHSMAGKNGKFYVAGGLVAGNPVNSIEIYDYATNTATSFSTLKVARSGLSVSAIGDYIMFTGNSVVDKTVELYNTVTDTWSYTSLGGQNTVRPHTTVLYDKLYIYGGSSTNVISIFEPVSNIWTYTTIKLPRDNMSVESAPPYLLIAGGANGGVKTNSVEILNVLTNEWIENTLSQIKWSMNSQSKLNKAIFGGGANPGAFNDVEIFDADTFTWTHSTLSAEKILGDETKMGVAVTDTKVEFLHPGGLGSGGYTTNVDVFEFAKTDPSTTDITNYLNTVGNVSINYKYTAPEVAVVDLILDTDFTYNIATLTNNRRNVGIGSENDIVVIGPGRQSSGLTDYDIYNATTGVWVTAASVAARYAHSMAGKNGKFYVAGGLVAGNPVNSIEIYDYATNTATSFTTLKEARSGLSVSAIGDYIMFTGNSVVDKTVELYNTVTDSWSYTTLGGQNTVRPHTTVLYDKLYIYGGSSTNVISIFEPISNTWTYTTIKLPRDNMSVESAPPYLLIAGGANGGVKTNSVEILNVLTNEWIENTLSQIKWSMNSQSKLNKAIFGGGANPGAFNDVEIFDADTFTWTHSTLSAEKILGDETKMGVTVLNDKIQFLHPGGLGNGGYTTNVDVFEFVKVEPPIDPPELYNNSILSHTFTTLSTSRVKLGIETIDHKMYFIGGQNSASAKLNTIDIYDSENNLWTVTTMSVERNGPTSVVLNNTIYIAGGQTDTGQSNEIEVFYPNTLSTVILTTLTLGRQNLTAGKVGNYLVFAGGFNAGLTNQVDLYNYNTDTWSTSTISIASEYMDSAVIEPNMYILPAISSNILDVYNGLTNTWSVATLSITTYRRSIVATTTHIIVAGGETGSPLNRLDIYDTVNEVWSTSTLGSTKRTFMGGAFKNLAMFAGGYDGGTLNSVDIYDSDLNIWSQTTMNQGLYKFGNRIIGALPLINGNMKFITAGGATPTSNSVEMYEFGLPPSPPEPVPLLSTLRVNGSMSLSVNKEVSNFVIDPVIFSHTTLSVARKQAVAGSWESIVVFAGGREIGGSYMNTLDIYNGTTDSWTQSSLTNERMEPTVLAYQNKFYIAGGNLGANSNSIEVFDYDANTVTSFGTLSTARYTLDSNVVGDYFMFFGDSSTSNVVDIYNHITDTWSYSTLSAPYSNPSSTVVDGVLYIGGSNNTSNHIDIYNSNTNTWSVATLSTVARTVRVLSASKYVLFAGGRIDGGSPVHQNNVDIYNTFTDTWTYTTLSLQRSAMMGGTIENKAIFAGGALNGAPFTSNRVDIFDAITNTWIQTTLINGDRDSFSQSSKMVSNSINNIKLLIGTSVRDGNIVDIFEFTKGQTVTLEADDLLKVRSLGGTNMDLFVANAYTKRIGINLPENIEPNYTLDVCGSFKISDSFHIGDLNSTQFSIVDTLGTNTNVHINKYTGGNLYNQLSLNSTTGYIGIGNNIESAIERLEVNGVITVRDTLSIGVSVSNGIDELEVGGVINATSFIGNISNVLDINWVRNNNDSNIYYLDGNISLGNPDSSSKLNVNGTIQSDYLYGNGSLLTDTERWFVDGNNLFTNKNVGIGTSVSNSELNVDGIVNAIAYIGDGSLLSNVSSENIWDLYVPPSVPEVPLIYGDISYLGGNVSINNIDTVGKVFTGEFAVASNFIYSTSTITVPRKDTAVASSGAITLVGTGRNSVSVNTVDIYNGDTDTWSVATINFLRYHHTIVGHSGKFYFAGGNDNGNTITNNIEVFDTNTNTGYNFGTLSSARLHPQSNAIGDYIVFFAASVDTNKIDIYNVVTDTWSYNTMSEVRSQANSAVLDDKLYIAGGFGNNNVDIFDPVANTWEIATISLASLGMAVEAAYPYLMIAGGWKGAYLNHIDIYNVETNTWSESTLLNPKRDMSSAGTYNKIIFAGGQGASKFNDVEIYDTITGLWSYTTLNAARILSSSESSMGISDTTSSVKFMMMGGLISASSNNVDIFEFTKENSFTTIGTVRVNGTINITMEINTTAGLDSSHTYSESTITVPRKDTAVASSGAITLVGTGRNSVSVNTVDIYNGDTDTWSVATINFLRYHHTIVGHSGKFYFAGGNDNGNTITNNIEVFDTNTNTGYNFGTLSSARLHPQSNAIGDYIVFFAASVDTNEIDIYNVVTDTWSYNTMSEVRSQANSAVLDGKLYIAGGFGNNNVDIFDPVANTWEIATITLASLGMAVEAAYPYLMIAGGWKGAYLNHIDIYNVETNTWSESTLLNPKRDMSSAGTYNKIIFAGGQGASKFNDVEIYDTITGLWSYTTLNVARILSSSESSMGISDTTSSVKFIMMGGLISASSNNVDIFEFTKVNLPVNLVKNKALNVVRPDGSIVVTEGYSNNFTYSHATLSSLRDKVAIGSTGALIMYACGKIGGTTVNDIDIYNFETDTWTVTTASQPLWDTAVLGHKGKFYIAGGSTAASQTNQIDVYDYATNTMLPFGTLSSTRASITVKVLGDLFVFAGDQDSPEGNEVDLYNYVTDTWVEATLSTNYSEPGSAVLNGVIYFAGSKIPSNKIDIYNSVTDTWSVNTLSSDAQAVAVEAVYPNIYYMGGLATGNLKSNKVDIYNVETDVWSQTTLSSVRTYTFSGSVGDKIFLAGGNDGASSNKVDIYNATTDVWITTTLSSARLMRTESISVVETATKIRYMPGGGTFLNDVDIFEYDKSILSTEFVTTGTNRSLFVTNANTGNIGVNISTTIEPAYNLDVKGIIKTTSASVNDVHIGQINAFDIVDDQSTSINKNVQISNLVDNQMFIDTTNRLIGIGANKEAPEYNLDINGTMSISDTLYIGQGTANTEELFVDNIINATAFIGNGSTITEAIWTRINDTDITYMLGNIGIRTSTPSATLEVIGNISASAYLLGNGSLLTDIDVWKQCGSAIYYIDGNVGINVDNPIYDLQVDGNIKAYEFIGNGSGLIDLTDVWIDDPVADRKMYTGDVAIGTRNSLATLTSNGTVEIIIDTDNLPSLIINGSTYTTDVPLHIPNFYNNNSYFKVNATTEFCGINTENPQASLHVVDGDITVTNGNFNVQGSALNVPDYVFESDYKLMPMHKLKQFITTNKHLPNVLSASTIQHTGVNINTFNMKLLEKIEEITLYTLHLQKNIDIQIAQNINKQTRILSLQEQNQILDNKITNIENN